MRINRYIAASGICSRRDAEVLIVSGRVSVNGKPVTELSTYINEDDQVTLDGQPIKPENQKVVYAFHKPRGVTVTMQDPKQSNLLIDWLSPIQERVLPVGRLDKDSSGLLLLTNDGQLIQRLTHPSYEKRKVYEITLDKKADIKSIESFSRGILLDGRMTAPAIVEVQGNIYRITLREGWNRQIRRMWAHLGYRVITLHRIQVDGICLGNLPEGSFRRITGKELECLYADESP